MPIAPRLDQEQSILTGDRRPEPETNQMAIKIETIETVAYATKATAMRGVQRFKDKHGVTVQEATFVVDAGDDVAGRDMLVVRDRNGADVARHVRRHRILARGDEGVVGRREMRAVIPVDVSGRREDGEDDRPGDEDRAAALAGGGGRGGLGRLPACGRRAFPESGRRRKRVPRLTRGLAGLELRHQSVPPTAGPAGTVGESPARPQCVSVLTMSTRVRGITGLRTRITRITVTWITVTGLRWQCAGRPGLR